MQQVRIARNVLHIIRESISDKKTSNGRDLGEVRIRRGIFQGDHSSPLLFYYLLDTSTDIRKADPS